MPSVEAEDFDCLLLELFQLCNQKIHVLEYFGEGNTVSGGSGLSIFLAPALFFYQHSTGVSILLVLEKFWCQHTSGVRGLGASQTSPGLILCIPYMRSRLGACLIMTSALQCI
jgi:hypothetical protein